MKCIVQQVLEHWISRSYNMLAEPESLLHWYIFTHRALSMCKDEIHP